MDELENIKNEAKNSARLWVNFVKGSSNEVWSKQQASFINECFKNLQQSPLSREIYLKTLKKIDKLNRKK